MASTKALGLLTLCMLLASTCSSAAEVLNKLKEEKCHERCSKQFGNAAWFFKGPCSLGCAIRRDAKADPAKAPAADLPPQKTTKNVADSHHRKEGNKASPPAKA
ncbi:hypothetical protein CKAN_00089100 [Cinnamomum micranthum f. kanehirae]|uniref:Uncharacterized protein n=1 Tax=Cinnamomum micranthum f. kanehirae TaxID=337451 RepID=A0A443N2A5_9MAGN|nr:hypothetical protein CKAN_00089100 [Cinnamomum micranthum f. kanehirae]